MTAPVPPPLDPLAYWREWVSQMEKGVNQFANKSMTSDEFAQGMNKTLGATMAGRKVARDVQQRYLELLNLPSRADVRALTEKVQGLEDRLIGIAATLERLERAAGGPGTGGQPAPAVRRTRKAAP